MSSIGRRLPQSNTSCKRALNTATAKEASSPSGNTIISAATKAKLIDMNDRFNAAFLNLILAEQAQRKASEDADDNRILGRDYIGSYFSTFNNVIRINKIPRNARAFYNIPISNDKQPVITKDVTLLEVGQLVIDGDAKRVLGGGVAMAFPTILEYTPVFTALKTSLTAFSTSKTNTHSAQSILNTLCKEAKPVITRVFNELETSYSDLAMPAKRAVSREWGDQFTSQGSPAFVTGIITDKDGLPISGVEVYLLGVGVRFISGIDGKYTVNTTLNGDLIVMATSPKYKENQTDILMLDGGKMEVNIVMEDK